MISHNDLYREDPGVWGPSTLTISVHRVTAHPSTFNGASTHAMSEHEDEEFRTVRETQATDTGIRKSAAEPGADGMRLYEVPLGRLTLMRTCSVITNPTSQPVACCFPDTANTDTTGAACRRIKNSGS